LEEYKASGSGIFSITVYAEKLDEGSCCDTTENGCCGSSVSNPATDGKAACCGTTVNSRGSGCC
jgi:arsenite methyltransferase